MNKLHWTTKGTGNINLILIHGWGFNSKVWNNIISSKLNKYFKFYLVDLPGFGKSNNLNTMNLNTVSQLLSTYIPNNSILLGWSMGGLIASRIGLSYCFNKIIGIITVSSSPCFISKPHWPGISKKNFIHFFNQLNTNFYCTISNFINLHTQKKYFKKNENLKKLIFSQPYPNIKTLQDTLNIIIESDLRQEMMSLKIPILRIYGSLDPFIPIKISEKLDKIWPNSHSKIIKKCKHLPFISHPKEFYKILLDFVKKIII